MDNYGHTAVKYVKKYFFEIDIANKFYWPIFLSILYSEYHLFPTNMIICLSLEEIYFEKKFSMSCFRMAQHHLFNFSAPP